MELVEVHLEVLGELADMIVKLLSITVEKSWQTGQISSDWKKGNITAVFKNLSCEDRLR